MIRHKDGTAIRNGTHVYSPQNWMGCEAGSEETSGGRAGTECPHLTPREVWPPCGVTCRAADLPVAGRQRPPPAGFKPYLWCCGTKGTNPSGDPMVASV